MSQKINKFLLLTILISFSGKLWAQRQLNPTIDRGPKTKIELIKGDSVVVNQSSRTFYGHVQFLHRGVYLYGDKVIHNSGSNNLQAFGNIKINQGDTLTITGDTLYYDGSTRFARILGKKVILSDEEINLESKRINYNLNSDMAYYPVPGIIHQDSVQLSSNEGFYNTNTKVFNYFGDVEILHPDFVLCTDSLDYDSNTKRADFESYTTISSPDGILSAKQGYYFTDTRKAKFFGASKFENEEYSLEADSLDFNMITNEGYGIGNVEFFNKTDSLILNGDYGEKLSSKGFTQMNGNVLMRSISNNDTLLLRAENILAYQFLIDAIPANTPSLDSLSTIETLSAGDSLEALSQSDSIMVKPELINDLADSIKNTVIIQDSLNQSDSSENEVDKIQFIKAFGDVKIFRNDFQAKCDSLNYNLVDSVITFIGIPIIWSSGNQLEGDLITAEMLNNQIKALFLDQSSFVISQDSSENFNQIKGRKIKASFDGKSMINKVEVAGNGQSIYFALDEEFKIIGLNKVECSEMQFSFEDQKVKRILFHGRPESQLIPPFKIGSSEIELDGFAWKVDLKPTKSELLTPKKIDLKTDNEPKNEETNSDF